jgi:hypothetical protein
VLTFDLGMGKKPEKPASSSPFWRSRLPRGPNRAEPIIPSPVAQVFLPIVNSESHDICSD